MAKTGGTERMNGRRSVKRMGSAPWLGMLAAWLVVLWAGCSTKKNTAYHRFYHRATSYFNYYHNAREAYKEGLRDAERKVRYDYSRPLPLSLAGLPESAQEVGGSMDRAIDKCADLIRYHSLTAKPSRGKEALTPKQKAFYSQNEFNPNARRAWLLIGKARVWANDFAQARQSLDFAMRQFPQQAEGWEAELWIARLDALEGDTLSARNRLQALSVSPLRPRARSANFLLWAFWADLHAQRGSLEQALAHATKALPYARGNRERTRVEMAMAQMHEELGNYTPAHRLYRRVARKSSNYELRFNSLIKSLGVAAKAEGKGIERTLRAMAEESKNSEYLDQIYFALGRIAMRRGDTAKGIELYKLSASSSTSNGKQKGIAFVQVGDYHYRHGDYAQAQAFYDSAVSVLPEGFARYDELMGRAVGLTRLVNAVRTVSREDSLQRIAKLPEAERNALIKELIGRVEEAERQAQMAEEQERKNREFATLNQYRSGQNNSGNAGQGWYFYNASTLAFGRSDFRLKWGDRRLEDNWRRKNKGIATALASEEDATSDSTSMVKDKRSPQYYLQHVPLSDSLVHVSHVRIFNALMQAAEAYAHEVQDQAKALRAYLDIAERYPEWEESAQALYLAYLTAKEHAPSEAERVRLLLLSQHGQSGYARMVSDPAYLERLKEQTAQWEALYMQGLEALLGDRRRQAHRLAQEGKALAARTDYEARFALLAALSAGSEAESSASIQALKEVGRLYPHTESAGYAADVLRAIDRKALTGHAGVMDIVATPTPRPEDTAAGGFVASDRDHWLAIILSANNQLNEWTFKVLGFSVDYNVDLNLEVQHEPMDEGISAVMVRTFADREQAEAFRMALVREDLFEGRSPLMLVISPSNFALLKRDRSYALYRRFYEMMYGNNPSPDRQ